MKRKGRIAQKLRNRGGETIAEALVAMLICVLAGVMLVAMIDVGVDAVKKSRNVMSDYYEEAYNKTGVGGTAATFKIDDKEVSVNYREQSIVGGKVVTYAKN